MTDKITRYADIPQFTRDGNWQTDFDLIGLVDFIKEEYEQETAQLNIYDILEMKGGEK